MSSSHGQSTQGGRELVKRRFCLGGRSLTRTLPVPGLRRVSRACRLAFEPLDQVPLQIAKLHGARRGVLRRRMARHDLTASVQASMRTASPSQAALIHKRRFDIATLITWPKSAKRRLNCISAITICVARPSGQSASRAVSIAYRQLAEIRFGMALALLGAESAGGLRCWSKRGGP